MLQKCLSSVWLSTAGLQHCCYKIQQGCTSVLTVLGRVQQCCRCPVALLLHCCSCAAAVLEQCYNTTVFQRHTNSVLKIKLKSYHGRPVSAAANKNSFLYFGNVQPLQKSRYHGKSQIYKSFRKKNVGDAKFFWLKKCLELFNIHVGLQNRYLKTTS